MGQGVSLEPIPDARLVEITGAHRTTVRRWKARSRWPRWLEQLVRVCVEGALEDIDPAWRGWHLRRGELVSPEGWTFTPGETRALTLLRGELARQRAEALQQREQVPDPNSQHDWIYARWMSPTEIEQLADAPPAEPSIYLAHARAASRQENPYWTPWRRAQRARNLQV